MQEDDHAHDEEQDQAPLDHCPEYVTFLAGEPHRRGADREILGESIFPSTPPDEFAAARSVGSKPASFAAVTCSTPNSEFDEVSEPVTATPSQPMIGERNGSTPPAPAIQVPIVVVCPERFMTYARPRTVMTVSVAHLSWSSDSA